MFNLLTEDPARVKIKQELKKARINYLIDESTKSLERKLGYYRVEYARNNPKYKQILKDIIKWIKGAK